MTTAAIYAALTIFSAAAAGFGAGYVIFSNQQIDLSEISEICKDDKICIQYTACLIANSNSKKTENQNLRNCDALLDVINFSERNRVLQNAFDYCESKQTTRDSASLCREYVRPK